MQAEFRRRQARALRLRLAPHTGLTVKVLAHALGRHPDTVAGWLHERATMDGAAIDEVDRFFAAAGDWGFLAEVYGEWRARALSHADALRRRAEAIERAAAVIGEVA